MKNPGRTSAILYRSGGDNAIDLAYLSPVKRATPRSTDIVFQNALSSFYRRAFAWKDGRGCQEEKRQTLTYPEATSSGKCARRGWDSPGHLICGIKRDVDGR